MKIVIVGAGMAGLACAERLAGAGHDVSLFDKGRGPGGRMATRRVDTPAGPVAFDHGAQYFTVRDERFRARVMRWRGEGVVAPWPAAGEDAWVGTPGMNAPVKNMARGQNVAWDTRVEGIGRDGGLWRLDDVEAAFDAVIVAVPAEQAGPLLSSWDAEMAAVAEASHTAPCWTVMAAFAGRLPIADDVLRDREPIGWAARDGAKPGRSGAETWVVQPSPAWSTEHLEEAPGEVLPVLLTEFARVAGVALPDPVVAQAHRWRYARSGAAARGALWNADLRLGACGDWLIGPRVEAAWLSGDRLAGLILQVG